MIPFEELGRVNRPFEHDLREAFEEVLASGRYVLGAQGEAFEGEFASSLGIRHAVGTGSGTDALAIALLSLGLSSGEVLVPANGCPATAVAVSRAGLVPVAADADPRTFLVDPEDAAARINAATVAIVAVHLYGLPCDMDALLSLAGRHGLAVVEDCAQGHGAAYRGRPVGTFGHAAAFSFYPTKNLGGLGDGGMVVTGDGGAAARARLLRNYGSPGDGTVVAAGFNSRLDELQAAFLRRKLPSLREVTARKNGTAAAYDLLLPPDLGRPSPVPGAEPARHVYPVTHPRRDGLRRTLAERGIGTALHYPVPTHRLAPFADPRRAPCPVAEGLCGSVLSLPLSLALSEGDVARVAEEAARACAGGAPGDRPGGAPPLLS